MEEIKNKLSCCHTAVFSSLAAVATILLIVLAVSGAIDIKDKLRTTNKTITVSATGEVYTKPDLAKTTFSVVTEAKTVSEALDQNTQKMNAIISFMKGQGVEEKDLKTTSFNIYPRYEWREKTLIYPQGERVLTGYEVSQSLDVKIRELAKTGDIIQGGVSAGANQVGSLQFTVENEDEFKSEARGKAIQEAEEKAKTLASQLKVKIVGISSFQESGGYPIYYGLEKMDAAAGGAPAPQIETGENKIEVTVSISYEIK
ncbi:MAG: SIMPL domain-containing protein [Candidatus Portnoybacteria bacterium]